MTASNRLVHLLRNISARELVGALERDGFSYRKSRGSGRVYRHTDRRRVVVHYHRHSDRFTPGTLSQMVQAARWTEGDARRLGLV